ncbi:hypothetical protein ABIB73_007504 [Bradyrhizobium sp. F1.4.3]|uniref:hypothetical protein n=1 Tax=Bradyrhizobium sp. F1.4.3 TaxID=3156356 RepID=UPI003395742B
MRLSGLFLLIVGALLCASIAWATIGFFAMALGLVCLQIPITRAPISSGTTARTDVMSLAPTEPIAVSAISSTLTATAEGGAQREELDWNTLVDRDEDLANVERLLSRYGVIYVDQLRNLYGIFNNKALLPSILNLIVESARDEAGRGTGGLAGTSAPGGHKPDTTGSLGSDKSIAAVDLISAPFAPRSSDAKPSSDKETLSSRSCDLPSADVASLEPINEVRASVDEDVVSFTYIFDQLSRSRK